MAVDYVQINASLVTSTQANELIQFIETLRNAINQAERVNGRMSHMSGSQIEAAYGLAVAGQGIALQALITSCRAAVRSAATLSIIDQYGQ